MTSQNKIKSDESHFAKNKKFNLQLRFLFQLLFKELRSQKKLTFFFIFNLVFGFLGYLSLETFQSSLSKYTTSKAYDLLGGDIALTARRQISESELQSFQSSLPQDYELTRVYDFFAMIKWQDKSRLALVRTKQPNYPLYGELKLNKTSSSLSSSSSNLNISPSNQSNKMTVEENESEAPLIWVEKDLTRVFGLQDFSSAKMQLGQTQFHLEGFIESEPTKTFRFASLAPLVIIDEKDLKDTALIQEGSTVTTTYLVKFKNKLSNNELLKIKERIESQIKDPALRVETALEEADSGPRLFNYFLDYLGLVTLIAMTLSLIGLTYLLNWSFELHKKNNALLKLLGLTDTQIVVLQIIKMTALSLVSFVISLLVFKLGAPFLEVWIQSQLNFALTLDLEIKKMLFILIVILIGPHLISWPVYQKLHQLSGLSLLREMVNFKISALQKIIWLGLVTLSFWGLAFAQSQSLKTSTLFVLGLCVSILIIQALIFGFLKLLKLITEKSFKFEIKYALASLVKKPQSSFIIFLTMTLSFMILSLLPHVKKSIINEIKPENAQEIPQLFMFDIQQDQKDRILSVLKNEFGIETELTPLVRSRILKVNDQNYERAQTDQNQFQTREEENEARFRNRGVNLTYKADLQKSETLVQGKWFNSAYKSEDLPEVSLEKRYAERIGIELNDVMTFDVQGLEVKAKVTSIRQVRWTSFQPNFFIVFQPGVLEEAPQNFLSALKVNDANTIIKIQNRIVEDFPNVSIVNVQETVNQSLSFIDQMALALQGMAYLSLFVGLFLLFVLVNTQMSERQKEMNLLRVLGSPEQQIQKIFLNQFMFIVIISQFLGFLMSLGMTYLLMSLIFNLNTHYDLNSFLILGFLTLILTYIILRWVLRKMAKIEPLSLLKYES